jgi:hypothetical protein
MVLFEGSKASTPRENEEVRMVRNSSLRQGTRNLDFLN